MKKIILIVLLLLIMLPPCFSEGVTNVYDWKYNGSGAGVIDGDGKNRNFLVYFNLADTERSDLYCNIGFSQLPFIKGSDIKGYDGNNLQMTWVNWGADKTVNLKASTYACWHVVVEGNHTLSLKLTPSAGAIVKCKYSQYSNETKGSSFELDSSKAVKGTLVTFTEIGRHYGSTLIDIEATVNRFSYTNDVLCTMTLILETGT